MLVAPSFAAFERLRRRSANCCKGVPPVLGELHPFAATETSRSTFSAPSSYDTNSSGAEARVFLSL